MYHTDDLLFIVIPGDGPYLDMLVQVGFEQFEYSGDAGYNAVTARASLRRAYRPVIVVIALDRLAHLKVGQCKDLLCLVVGIYYVEVFVMDGDNVGDGIEYPFPILGGVQDDLFHISLVEFILVCARHFIILNKKGAVL